MLSWLSIVSVTLDPAYAYSVVGENFSAAAVTKSDCGPTATGGAVVAVGGGGGGGGCVAVGGTGIGGTGVGGTGVSVGGTGVAVGSGVLVGAGVFVAARVGVTSTAAEVARGVGVCSEGVLEAAGVPDPVALGDGAADSESPPQATVSRSNAAIDRMARGLTRSNLTPRCERPRQS